MKTIVALLISLIVVTAIALPALATPPSDILATYDNSNHFLTVRVLHGTLSATLHYIKYIEVKLGDQLLLAENFRSQTNNKEQDAVVYMIDLKPGAAITVNAQCSWFGSKTKTITL